MPPRILPPLLVLLVAVLLVAAEDLSCTANVQISGQEYDWTSLNIAKTAERTRNTPPTTMIDSILFNICSELESQDVPPDDQVSRGRGDVSRYSRGEAQRLR